MRGDVLGYLINQTPRDALRRGRTSTTLVDLTLVLWTPGPIRSHREEFLPEGLRAYGPPLYTNSLFFIRRQLFYYNAISQPFYNV
jgi:hypothetical protein